MGLLGALTLWRLVEIGWPVDSWAWAKWIAWFVYLYKVSFMLLTHLLQAYWRIFTGWPSQVMMYKFRELFQHAEGIKEDLGALFAALPEGNKTVDGVAIQAAIDELHEGLKHVQIKEGSNLPCKGPFGSENPIITISIVFGSLPSWRWLLPLVAGGSGDPMQPTGCSIPVCEAWSNLAAAMRHGSKVIAEHHHAAKLWSQRVQAMQDSVVCQAEP